MLVVALAIASVMAEPEAANSEVHFILGNQEYRYVLDNFQQAVPVVPAAPEDPAAAPVAPVVPVAPAGPLVYAAVPHHLPAVPYHVPAVAPAAPVVVAAPAVPAVVKGAFGPVALPAGYHQTIINQQIALAKPSLPVPVEAPVPEAVAAPVPAVAPVPEEVAAPEPAVAPVPGFAYHPAVGHVQAVAPVPVAAPVPAAPAVVGNADPNLVYSVIPHPANPLYSETAPTHYVGKREAEADPEAEAAQTWYGLHYNPLSGCRYNPYNCGQLQHRYYGYPLGYPYGYPYLG